MKTLPYKLSASETIARQLINAGLKRIKKIIIGDDENQPIGVEFIIHCKGLHDKKKVEQIEQLNVANCILY